MKMFYLCAAFLVISLTGCIAEPVADGQFAVTGVCSCDDCTPIAHGTHCVVEAPSEGASACTCPGLADVFIDEDPALSQCDPVDPHQTCTLRPEGVNPVPKKTKKIEVILLDADSKF